jgi:Ser/Thr protein kinase RdoA (MazF antagonist)
MEPTLQLRTDIGLWLNSIKGGPWRLGPLMPRTHSITAVAESSVESGRKLFLKIPRPDDDSAVIREQFAAEYAGLEMAHTALAAFQNRYCVPAPVSKNDLGWFAIEHIEGRRADAILASNIGHAARAHLLREIGSWIGHLHTAFAQADQVYDFASYRARILTLPIHQYPGVVRRAAECLDQRLPELTAKAVPYARIHGDLKVDNFLLTDRNTLIGFDLSLANTNPVIFDLSAFLNRLHVWTLSPGGMRNIPMRDSMQSAFLEGYGATASRFNNTLSLHWMQLALACATYDDVLTNNLRTRGTLRRWTLALRYAMMIRSLTRKLVAVAT